MRTHLRCPYHAWGYALDGTLVTTPMIEKDEIDRPSTSLWPVHVDVWEGFVFVNLSREEPRPLLEHLADQQDEPLTLARFGLADLRIGHVTTNEVQANWKIVHRELQRVPALPDDPPRAGGRRAGVQEGQHLRERPRRTAASPWPTGARRSSTTRGCGCRCCRGSRARASDPESYYGAVVYPTMFLDVDGSSCLATAVFPTGPQSCRLVTEYLFSPEALEDPDFDPSPVVEFNERVTRQDNEACERVQRGVTSRAFDHGVFPAKDSWVYGFDQRYLRDVETD